MGVHKDIESALVGEGNDDTEALVVQAVLGSIPVKIVVAYGPQENAKKEKKEKFWNFIEDEVKKAEIDEHGLIIQMDGNLHGGPDLIKKDPNPQNKNGKLFKQFLERNPSLSVANNLNICKGIITRQRKVEGKIEMAILDFFIMNEKLRPFLAQVIIDEERNFSLSNFAQLKKNNRVIESDHNSMIADFNISIPKRKPERIELFNLRNENCQKLFTKETDENNLLVECFESNLPFEVQCEKWLKTFNSILYKCFKKVRIVDNKKKKNKNDTLLKERVDLKKEVKLSSVSEEMKMKIRERISQIEEDIGNEISEEYFKEILDTITKLGGDEQNLNGSGRKELWKLLKTVIQNVYLPYL